MSTVKRQWDLLSKERKAKLLPEIITFVKNNLDQQIGLIAAEEFLDFFLQELVEDIYNKAITDSKTVIKQTFDNLDIDLDQLLNK